jgi:hypothetical protein
VIEVLLALPGAFFIPGSGMSAITEIKREKKKYRRSAG